MKWIGAWIMACLMGWSVHAMAAPTPPGQPFTSAEYVATDAPQPPMHGWQTVSLPDAWRRTHPALEGYAWYRMTFVLPARPEQPLALYIPHLALVGEIRLNGSILNEGVVFDAPNGVMGTSMDLLPVHMTLPSGLFRAGDNVLEIRLQGNPRLRSGLSEVWLGPPTLFRRAYLVRYTLLVIVPSVVMVLLAASLCFFAVYAWRRRGSFAMQVSALAGAAFLVAFLTYQVFHVPQTRSTDMAMRVAISTILYWGLCVAGYRMAGFRLRGFLPVLHTLSAACLLALLVWTVHGGVGDRAWLLTWPLMPVRFWLAGLFTYDGWRRRSGIRVVLGLTALLWLLTLMQSNMMLADLLPWDAFTLSIAGVLPLCAVLFYYFAEGFIVDRNESQLAQKAAIVAERERILQDMHDGMGAQLITAMRLANRDDVARSEVARYIEESFLDLRLIIDSLDLTEKDLLPLLGNLRFRLDPRLRALGIHLIWDVTPLPPLPYLTPESALAVLRIVQEALNNAIVHARPSTIRVTVRPERTGAIIQVADNGPGFDIARTRQGGRGLQGMRQRALKLGAVLDVRSSAAGTDVALRLP